MDFQLQYFVPPGFISAPPGLDRQIMDLGASLRGADTEEGAIVPDTPLTIRLNLMENGAGIDFLYYKKLTYINFCCFEKKYSSQVFDLVGQYYKEYQLGAPKKPTLANWIHLIPIGGEMPDVRYSLLSQQLTVAHYWAAYGQRLKRVGRL